MGSVGNQNPWAPYDSYKDCSLGICSVYCPQWCFYVLPPPPPSDDDDDSSGPTFSPLIIAIIGILASAFLLVTYYTLITKYCTRRRDDNNNGGDVEANPHPQGQCHVSGLDESAIKSIAVCKYRKGDAGFVEGTECSVCLCEFEDGENLRLLPKCTHAFHLPCIDTWLKSHSNCPLCRANIIVNSSPPPPTLDVTQTELVLVIDSDEEGVVSTENNGDEDEEEEEEGVKHLRRSISLGTFFTQKRLLVSDQELQGDGSNSKCNGAIGRSISTGRLNFSRYDDNGSNSTILV